MEIKLRQRLVGVVVLAALAVIFLPTFFKGTKPETRQPIALDTPSSSSAKTTPQIIVQGQDEAANTAAPNAPAAVSSDEASKHVSNPSQQTIAANQAAMLGGTAAVPVNNQIKKPVNNPNQLAFGNETMPVVSSATPVVTKEEADVTAANTSLLAEKTKAVKKIHSTNDVTVAKKTKSDTAKESLRFAQQQVQAEMANISSATPVVKTKKSNAESVNNDETSAELTNPPVASAWVVQLGSFSSNQNAKKLVTDLRAKGFAAYSRMMKSDGSSMVKVFVGPEIRRNWADTLQAKLDHDLHLKGVVVPFDPLVVK